MNEGLEDELYSVNAQMDSIIDLMIEKYGKFVTKADLNGASDAFKADLVRNYDSLQKRKDYLAAVLSL